MYVCIKGNEPVTKSQDLRKNPNGLNEKHLDDPRVHTVPDVLEKLCNLQDACQSDTRRKS